MDIKNLKDKVETILTNFPDTRNDDILLMVQIWWNFHRQFIEVDEQGKNGRVYLRDLHKLPTHESIKRIRAKFQNEEKRFLPTDEVVAKRRGLEKEWRAALGYKTSLF